MKNQPQKVQYTLDYKHRVNFTCHISKNEKASKKLCKML